MRNFSKFEGKLIRMNKSYPIHNDDDEIVGYTEVGDMAVITFAEIKKKIGYKTVTKISDELSIGIPVVTDGEEGYFETIIVSGKYTGIDSLALDLEDIATSTFIFNKVDGDDTVYIQDRKINFEYVWFVDEFLVQLALWKENIVSENNKLQLCEEFLEYLIDKYAMFERKAESDPHYSGIGDYINIKGVVAEYFGTEEL